MRVPKVTKDSLGISLSCSPTGMYLYINIWLPGYNFFLDSLIYIDVQLFQYFYFTLWGGKIVTGIALEVVCHDLTIFPLHGGMIKHLASVMTNISDLCNRQNECMTWREMVSTWAPSCWNSVWLSCWPKWWFWLLFHWLQIVSVLYKSRVSTASTHTLCAKT